MNFWIIFNSNIFFNLVSCWMIAFIIMYFWQQNNNKNNDLNDFNNVQYSNLSACSKIIADIIIILLFLANLLELMILASNDISSKL